MSKICRFSLKIEPERIFQVELQVKPKEEELVEREELYFLCEHRHEMKG